MDLPAALHRVLLPVGQCYLWRDGDEVTLVDTGPPGSGDRIAAELAAMGLDRDAVVRVVITHFHGDHAGSAADVRSWSGAGPRWRPRTSAPSRAKVGAWSTRAWVPPACRSRGSASG